MRKVTTENIMTYLDGKASDAEKSELEAHLVVCAECSRSKDQIQALESRLRQEPRFEPPEHALQAWFDLFPVSAELSLEPKRGSLPRIVASLIYDTFAQPMLAEVRSLCGCAPSVLASRRRYHRGREAQGHGGRRTDGHCRSGFIRQLELPR